MYRLKDVVEGLDYNDLLKLKHDLDSGAYHIKKLLKENIRNHEKDHQKLCSNCLNELNPHNVNNYTLVFGPEDFKKKASFCGLDCLEYFLRNLKEIKKR